MKVKYLIVILFLICCMYPKSHSAEIKVAFNSSWPSLNKLIIDLQKNENNKKLKNIFSFNPLEMESSVVSNLVNLQADIAIIPIDQYHKVYDYKNSLTKFVIRALIAYAPVGVIYRSNCKKIASRLWIDPHSSEWSWFSHSGMEKNKKIANANMYSLLQKIDSNEIDCFEYIVGSERFFEKLQNKKLIKFETLGDLPFLLLVEEHFMRSRKNDIKDLVDALNQRKIIQEHSLIRDQIIKYNFAKRQSEWNKLDEYIKVE